MHCESDSVEVKDKMLMKSDKTKKTNAQRCREYRERHKKFKNVRVTVSKKSNAERSKAYRERQKMKKQIELQQKSTDHLQSKSTKTSAEYMREYRRKMKLKNQCILLNALLAKDHSDAKMMSSRRQKWSESDVESAINSIKSGRSMYSVTKETGIPYSTLRCKYKGFQPMGKSVGPSTVLTRIEEAQIVQWMLYCSDKGFSITENQLMSSVKQLVKKLNRDTPFKDGCPGRHWYEGFLRRHPTIKDRIAENLTHSRVIVYIETMRNWFATIKEHLDEKNLTNIDGSRIFSCGESTFYTYPTGDKVLVNKDKNDGKKCLTTLFTINAVGMLLPPMIIFSYARVPDSNARCIPSNWSIGKTESGWMTPESFFEYISNVFEPWLTGNQIERPVIIYLDGHSSHITYPTIEFCIIHEIELIALYPNATHLIQPLDVALFQPLKAVWEEKLHDWRLQNKKKLRREDLAPLLKSAIDTLNLAIIIPNAFKSCGLYPFSADVLNDKELQEDSAKHKLNSTKDSIDFSEDFVKKCRAYMDLQIGQQLVTDFQTAAITGEWTGDIENHGLFRFWMQLAQSSSHL